MQGLQSNDSARLYLAILLHTKNTVYPFRTMLDGFHVLALTHRTAPLELIGRAVIPAADQATRLSALKAACEWDELLYLATCNRVLLLYYASGPLAPQVPELVAAHIAPELNETEQAGIAAAFQHIHGADAVRHIMEVAASMDSLVVGEREIIRQFREAYNHCNALSLSGDHIRLLVRFTIEIAKDIYTRTGIGEKALSVVALAFKAMQDAGIHPKSRILMVGAGVTNAKFVQFLQRYGYRNVTVFNRSFEKAEMLAEAVEGRAFQLDELPDYREAFDALVVCTGSTEAIITPALYQTLVGQDTAIKVLIDLSIPHNVAPEVAALPEVQYIKIESLRAAADANLAHRARACEEAAEIIRTGLYEFREIWHERQIERSLAHIPDEVRDVKTRAMNEVFGKELARVDASTLDLIERMMGYMEKKCVAIPIKAAKQIALQHKKEHHARK